MNYEQLDKLEIDELALTLYGLRMSSEDPRVVYEFESEYLKHRYLQRVSKLDDLCSLVICDLEETCYHGAYFDKLFESVLDNGLLDCRLCDLALAFSLTPTDVFSVFCLIIADRVKIDNPEHVALVYELTKLEGFLPRFYAQLPPHEVQFFVNAFNERGLSYIAQINECKYVMCIPEFKHEELSIDFLEIVRETAQIPHEEFIYLIQDK